MSELLAPAGSLENLYWACAYGADAVYFGLQRFSLRSFAGNLTLEESEKGLHHLHTLGKKGYATLNIYPFSDEYEELRNLAGILSEQGVDAFIASDIGVIGMLIKEFPKTPIHVSTQANTVSAQTALFYKELGAKRVNLARELTLEQIEELQKRVGSSIETEVFIHGSVCFSYSGRCAISDYLSARGGNRGECSQSCRWKYSLMEEQRPGEYMPVFEDERGSYILNSKDLALYRFMPELLRYGVSSFKIEGRMKSIHYVSSILAIYRALLDGKKLSQEDIDLNLSRVSNRGYTEGFMKGINTPDDYNRDKGGYVSTSLFLINTLPETQDGMRKCLVKGTVNAGEELEVLTPEGKIFNYRVPNPIMTAWGKELEKAQNCHIILLPCEDIPDYSILRRVN